MFIGSEIYYSCFVVTVLNEGILKLVVIGFVEGFYGRISVSCSDSRALKFALGETAYSMMNKLPDLAGEFVTNKSGKCTDHRAGSMSMGP